MSRTLHENLFDPAPRAILSYIHSSDVLAKMLYMK